MVKEDFKNENDLLRHIMTVDKNVEQGRALKKIFTTRENLFITGRAGSGKSTFMRRIVKFLGKCVIVAPHWCCGPERRRTNHSLFLRYKKRSLHPLSREEYVIK